MKIVNLVFLSLLISFLAGCGKTVEYLMPETRMLSPETQGSLWKGEVSFNGTSSQEMILSKAVDSMIFNVSSVSAEETLHDSWGLGFGAGVGLHEKIDVYVRTSSDSPSVLGLKFQFIGQGADKNTTGWKSSLFAGFGNMEEDEGTLTVNPQSQSSRTYSGNIKVDVQDYGVVTGYRKNESVLYYSNLYYSQYRVKSTLTSTNHPTINVDGDSDQYGALLGLEYGAKKAWDVFFRIESGYVLTKWNSSLKKGNIPFAALVGFSW